MRASIAPFQPVMRSSDGRLMGEGRSGLHLGTVIKSLREFVDGPAPRYSNDNFAIMGFMLELWVGEAMRAYLGHEVSFIIPGEMEVDSIFMNPDGYDPVEEEVLEFKCVWKKALNDIEPTSGEFDVDAYQKHFWFHLTQVMSYCRGLGCLKAKTIVLFVQGGKATESWGPHFRIFQWEFTPEELDKNWAVITQHAETLR